MAKSQSTETKSTLEPHAVLKTFNDVQTAGLGSLAWMGTRWIETMGDLGAERLNFVAERIKEDVKTQHQMLHAKTVSDIQQIQATFLQRALDDYRDETGKIVKFCSDAMSDIQEKAKTDTDQPKT